MGKFSEDELTVLHEQFGPFGAARTAAILNRSPASVTAKARKLGLTRSWGEKLVLHDHGLTIEQVAYLAGFIDGDGSVSLQRWSGKKNRRPAIRLCNTSDAFLAWCQRYLDLPNTYCDSRTIGSGFSAGTSRVIFVYSIVGMSHLPLYRALLPHLVIKRPQMEMVVEWVSLRLLQTWNEPYTQRQQDLEAMVRFMNLPPSQASEAERLQVYQSSTWEPALERMRLLAS